MGNDECSSQNFETRGNGDSFEVGNARISRRDHDEMLYSVMVVNGVVQHNRTVL